MGKNPLRYVLVSCLAMVFSAAAPSAGAAPAAELWERWTAFDATSPLTVDHQAWDRFLKSYVVEATGGVNRLSYARVTGQDRQALAGYIERLGAVAVGRLSRGEQLAMWINLYNALTVKVVLDHFPVDSIRNIDISPGLFADGPWGRTLIEIEGEAVSLDDIEHRIVRPIWKDPRIHYALNCAALGCPNLLPGAFSAANTEALLEAAARMFVNDPRGVGFDDGRLIVSSLYVWYAGDFGGSDKAIIAHLKRYAEPPLRAKLGAVEKIDDDYYDWTLNAAK